MSSIEIGFPDDWQHDDKSPRIPGIDFEDPVTVSPAADETTGLVSGIVDSQGPRLLPDEFLRRLTTKSPQGEPVMLGEYEALRHEGLQLKGSERIYDVYAIPTTAGVATLVCFADAPVDAFFSECASVAGTVSLTGARPFALGPSAEYTNALNREIERLGAATEGATKALNEAKTPGAQAKAADELAAAYRDAGDALRKIEVGPAAEPATARVQRALSRLRSAYADLASAARKGSGSAYKDASSQIARGEKGLDRALRGLAPLGYEIET